MRKSTVLFLAALSLAPFAQAQNTLAGNLTVQQTVKLTGAASPAQLTANANDYAPAGFATAAVLRIQSDAPRAITGLAGGVAGRMVWLTNVGAHTISLATESASSAAADRFAFGASGFDLYAGGSLSIWYDTASSRWRAATNLAAGGGGTTIDQTARDAAAAAQATADSKQPALANAATLAKVGESAGLPLWDGAAWPGGGSGGSGTVTSVSVVTANGVSGSVANASTTPAISLSLGAITPTSVAASGSVTGSNLSGTNTGDQTSVTGNAGTATALATARTINGVSFNGTANITVPAAAGTLTGATLASGVTASSLTSAAGGSFGTAAFTATTAYDPAGAAAAITLAGLGGVPTTRTVNGHALSGNVSVSASDVGLGSVENTALSTWTGSSNLATVGTITAGTWTGSAIADTYVAGAAAWNAKVSFPGFGTTGTTAAVGNDARLSDARAPTAHNQAWSTITTTPTTLSGYGISDAQGLDFDLTALAANATNGLWARTGAGAGAARTITGTAGQVTVTNGDGVAGNPTLALPQSIATTSTPQFAGINLTGQQKLDTGTGTLPTTLGGSSLITAATDGAQSAFECYAFGSVPGLSLKSRVFGGTRSAVAATPATPMLNFAVFGHDGVSATTGAAAQYQIWAGSTWSSTSRETFHTWSGTAAGSTTIEGWMRLLNGILTLNKYGAGTLVTDSSGNVTTSSDRRLKNVSGKFTRGLDAIIQIQPKVFTWKPESGMNPADVNVGFIAQEVQPAIPEAVGSMKTAGTEEDDGTGKKVKKSKREASEYLTLSDRPIIATLVNAVKELKAENDDLRARVSDLENGKAAK